ncbi:uncharacterized protein LOC134215868 [Armigeres subalbatus]|uniref:uncharacterized protein LOC134215868 n=1 Tax=Armigeres subalbatus TaxID=124917 RepID=UPI002ED64A05
MQITSLPPPQASLHLQRHRPFHAVVHQTQVLAGNVVGLSTPTTAAAKLSPATPSAYPRRQPQQSSFRHQPPQSNPRQHRYRPNLVVNRRDQALAGNAIGPSSPSAAAIKDLPVSKAIALSLSSSTEVKHSPATSACQHSPKITTPHACHRPPS